jgi:hypothetical protein
MTPGLGMTLFRFAASGRDTVGGDRRNVPPLLVARRPFTYFYRLILHLIMVQTYLIACSDRLEDNRR